MRSFVLVPLVSLVACDTDRNFTAESRILDGFSYVDAGAVAVATSHTFTVPLFSKGDSGVRIFEIQVETVSEPEGLTDPAFVVDDSAWALDCDRDEDGVDDCLDLERYDSESEADTLPLPVQFSPPVKGYYEGILTVWSNDNSSTETAPLPDDETQEWTVWRVQLRGLSDYACGQVLPAFYDFGHRPVGGDFNTSAEVVNCGIVPLIIDEINLDEPSLSARTLPPLTVLAGQTEPVVVGWTVADEAVVDGHLSFVSNSDGLNASTVRFIGNDCSESLHPADWDKDADGWTSCGGDCDDTRDSDSPSRNEIAADGRDNDCDGQVDEAGDDTVGTDDDGDGCSESGGDCGGLQDCDDGDPAIGPHADEVLNQVDDDCDGTIDEGTDAYDDDGDGWSELTGDCDDAEPLVSPDATEVVDGRDNDCDGILDEGGPNYDDDNDGFKDVESDFSQNDCDDRDPWVYVGAREYCDGYDNDCDGLVDDGEDNAEGGACTFVPLRKDTKAADTGEAAASGGCDSGAAGASWIVAAGLGALVPRRRRD